MFLRNVGTHLPDNGVIIFGAVKLHIVIILKMEAVCSFKR
jgi:hypothetical protein